MQKHRNIIYPVNTNQFLTKDPCLTCQFIFQNLQHVIILALISIGYGSAESTIDLTQESPLEDLGKKLLENEVSLIAIEESSNDLKTSESIEKSQDLEVSSPEGNEDFGKSDTEKIPEDSGKSETEEIPEDSEKSDAAETTEASDLGKLFEEIKDFEKINQESKDEEDLKKLSLSESLKTDDLKNLNQEQDEKKKIEEDPETSITDIKNQLKSEKNKEIIIESGKSDTSDQKITKRVDKIEDEDNENNFRGENWFDDDEPSHISNRISRPEWIVEKPKFEFPKTNKDTNLPIYQTPFISTLTNSVISSVLHQKPQILDTHHAEINIYHDSPQHRPPQIKPNLHHIIVGNEIPKYPYITQTIKNIPTPQSPINFDDEFVKPILERRKTFWEQIRDQIKKLEEKMIIKKKLEILEDYKNKLISTQKAFIEGFKRKFTISIPTISSSGINFEKKEVDMF